MPLTRMARDKRRIGAMKSRKTFSDRARWSFQGNCRRKTAYGTRKSGYDGRHPGSWDGLLTEVPFSGKRSMALADQVKQTMSAPAKAGSTSGR
jgi:hypothetical protein